MRDADRDTPPASSISLVNVTSLPSPTQSHAFSALAMDDPIIVTSAESLNLSRSGKRKGEKIEKEKGEKLGERGESMLSPEPAGATLRSNFKRMSRYVKVEKIEKEKEKEKEISLQKEVFPLDADRPPIQQGYLMWKNAKHRWKRRWVVVDSESLHIFNEAFQNGVHLPLLGVAVKPVVDKQCNFVVITAIGTYNFLCETPKEMFSWVNILSDICETLTLSSIQGPLDDQKRRLDPHPLRVEMSSSAGDIVDVENDHFSIISSLLRIPGNNACCDCGSPDPEWASINLGVFICLQCSGVHRSLGSHISKVRSLYLDEWHADTLKTMGEIGNRKANETYEYNIPHNIQKPNSKSTREERERFIKMKYEQLLFTEQSSFSSMFSALTEETFKIMFLHILRHDPHFRAQVRDVLQSTDDAIIPLPPSAYPLRSLPPSTSSLLRSSTPPLSTNTSVSSVSPSFATPPTLSPSSLLPPLPSSSPPPLLPSLLHPPLPSSSSFPSLPTSISKSEVDLGTSSPGYHSSSFSFAPALSLDSPPPPTRKSMNSVTLLVPASPPPSHVGGSKSKSRTPSPIKPAKSPAF